MPLSLLETIPRTNRTSHRNNCKETPIAVGTAMLALDAAMLIGVDTDFVKLTEELGTAAQQFLQATCFTFVKERKPIQSFLCVGIYGVWKPQPQTLNLA